MKNKLKQNKKYILFGIYLLLVFSLFFSDFDAIRTHHNYTYLFVIFTSFLLILIIFLFVRKFIDLSKDKYYKFYFILVMVMGSIFITIAPAFMGSDEKTHFSRAFEISEGHFVTSSNGDGVLATMPRSINKAYTGYDDENKSLDGIITYSDSIKRMKIPLNKDNKLNFCSCNQTNYFGASLYSPFQYIPHLIGLELGKILNLGPYWLLMLGRFTNLVCFAILTTIGIKILPKFKLVAMLLLCSPVVLVGATTFSADGITNALVFLYVAYILYLVYTKKLLSLKLKIFLFLLAFFIAMCKIVYFPVILLVFLLPKQSFKNKNDSKKFKIFITLFSVCLSLIWLYFATKFLNNSSAAAEYQEKFVFLHMFKYIIIIFRTYVSLFGDILTNIFFGNQLYHWQLKVYSFFSLAYVFIISCSIFTEKGSFSLTKNQKILIFLIVLMIIGLISTALFVQITSPNNKEGIISGIQARYFIPILLVCVSIINIKKVKFKEKDIFSLFMFMYFPAILTIIVRFI